MCLDEGGTELIAPDIVQLQDEDTELESLRVVLSEPPMAGSVRNNNIPLRQGDSFTLHDVELFRCGNSSTATLCFKTSEHFSMSTLFRMKFSSNSLKLNF